MWLCRKSLSVCLSIQPLLLLHRCNYVQNFLNRFILLYFMCVTITWICLSFIFLPSPLEDRRGSRFPWNWSYRWLRHMGAGSETWVLWKCSKYLNFWDLECINASYLLSLPVGPYELEYELPSVFLSILSE